MTLKGHKQLSKDERALMLRLMYILFGLHPTRLGRLFGVHGQYVRQQWRDWDGVTPMAPLEDGIEFIAKHLKTPHST